MKLIDLSLDQARKEFGDRLVTLNTGKAGVRAGIHTTCKDVAGDAPVGVVAQFSGYCQRPFCRLVNATEVFPADHAEFILSRAPVESVLQVELKVAESDGWAIQTDPNFIRALNLVNGIVDCGPGDAGPYYGQVRFTFTGGYFWEQLEPDDPAYPSQLPIGANAIPDDLRNAWLLQCRHLWSQLDKIGTELLKDGSEKSLRFPDDFAPTVENVLGDYIRYKLT